ncbi:unnamed protein product [Gadus morhua 'NCC']
MAQVFPVARLRARVQNSAKTFAPGAGSVSSEEENCRGAWLREETAAVPRQRAGQVRRLVGMNQEQAMGEVHGPCVKEWRVRSTLFNVEVRTPPCMDIAKLMKAYISMMG